MKTKTIELRPEVQRFAARMEAELRAHDNRGKRGWTGCDIDWLVARLVEETSELKLALKSPRRRAKITGEAADVANFAMMIADVAGDL